MDIPQAMIDAAESHSDEILALAGVTGWDVGLAESGDGLTGDYAIRIYVADLSAAQVPDSYDGFPTNVLEATFALDADTNRYDPLIAGCEIENGDSDDLLGSNGTLGVIVHNTDRDVLCGLTCAHVVCVGNFHAGDQICQPARTAAGPPPPANVIGLLSDFSIENDAAIFEIRESITPTRAILDIGAVAGSRSLPAIDPASLPHVRKRGRTTPLTDGHIIARQRLATTDQNGRTLPPHVTVLAVSPLPFSGRGDSGAAIVDDDAMVLGMHFARSDSDGKYGLAIPWDDLAARFPIEVATGP
jgi:hypothetical protein